MKIFPIALLTCALISLHPAGAEDVEEASLVGFDFSVPEDWVKVDERSKFLDEDGFISAKVFDLDGKEVPITVTARRLKREPELTGKNIEERLKAFVEESLAKTKEVVRAPDYAGPEVTKSDLDACILETRKVGDRPVYISTFINTDQGGGENAFVMMATTVAYIDGDSICVLSILGVVQHFKDYAEEIRAIAESAKPKGD